MDPAQFSPLHLGWADAAVRIGAALLLSLAIGLERYWHKKPVDFRPFAIIALASASLSLSIVEFARAADDATLSVDPAKVVSGIMTGIGFLGAGALFRQDDVVQGAGSAASIWAAGAIGIVCGLGQLWLAAMLAAAILLLLIAGRPFTDRWTIRASDPEKTDDDA